MSSGQGHQSDSSILKVCKCGRPFDPFSGLTLRIDEEEYMPVWIIRSIQPCGKCDWEYYHEKRLERLKEFEGKYGTGKTDI